MRAALLAVLLVLAVPAAAGAATVTALDECGKVDPECTTRVEVVAAAGEANAIEISRDRGSVDVVDRGAPLVAGAGCDQLGRHAVNCEPGRVSVDLGDGDDTASRVAAGGRRLDTVTGGEGNDRVKGFPRAYGGGGTDIVAGTASADSLDGGAESDHLLGGAGDDFLSGDGADTGFGYGADDGPIAADVLEGGPGADVAVYLRATPVRVDLADPGPDGGADEGDRLTGIEGAQGGSAADTLIGDGGPNQFVGDSADHIECRGGRDLIDGAGILVRGCERLRIQGSVGSLRTLPVRERGGRLAFRLPCHEMLRANYRRGPCRIVLTATHPSGRRTVVRRRLRPGGGRVSVPAGDPAAPLQLSVRYPGSFDGDSRASWLLPDGGRGGG